MIAHHPQWSLCYYLGRNRWWQGACFVLARKYDPWKPGKSSEMDGIVALNLYQTICEHWVIIVQINWELLVRIYNQIDDSPSPVVESSLLSEEKPVMTGWMPCAGAQTWSLKTRRVITKPQWQLAKSFLNSSLHNPPPDQESSWRMRSNTLFQGLGGLS